MNEFTKIFADFNNTDKLMRIRLNTNGSLHDLQKLGSDIQIGLEVLLDDDDELTAKGILEFSNEENIWVAVIDWKQFD